MRRGLVVKGLSKQLGGKNILSDISFEVNPGEVIGLVGGSGSGKTTLLKTINRLIDYDDGEVLLNGTSTRTMDPIELRRRVGMVLQNPIMFDGTVKDNIMFGIKLRNENGNTSQKIFQAIADAGLPKKFLNKDANKLSGGEQQRVALARLLVLEPSVLLLDEPTAALDPKLTRKIEDTVLELCKSRNLIILWVTHNHAQARRLSDYIGILKNGVIKIIPNSISFKTKRITNNKRIKGVV
ncbi:ABC transporter ATP-binding protein [[Eubacterium] cellulosolvens]